MASFLFGLIVGSMSSKSNKSGGYGPKSVTPPKPKLPPRPITNYNNLISLKFCKGFDWSDIEIIELNSYREFFLFYQENHDKGCIYDVKLKQMGGYENERSI